MPESYLNKYRFSMIVIILSVLLGFTFMVAPMIGGGLNNLFSSDIGFLILFELRYPRVVFAFLVGFSLALIGLAFQALLQNELATPYTLGVASGGALGAVIAIKAGLVIVILGFPITTLFSVMGSLLTITIIYFVSHSRVGLSKTMLVLTGVTISLLFSSIILFIHYLADFTETYRMIRWLMGGLQVTGWSYTLVLLPIVLIAAMLLFKQAAALNIISSGNEMALSKGVDILRLQRAIFIIGSVLIGVIVAFAGPIGFVGLIIPHLVRLLLGAEHRKLVAAVPLLGGIFLVWCDTLARTIIAPAELPVGIITAMLGGPFFIWLLIRKKRSI